MAQRQFRSDDTSKWHRGYGNKINGAWAPTTQTLTEIDAVFTGNEGNKFGAAVNPSFAPGQFVIIMQMYGANAGQWEFNRIASYSAGVPVFSYPLTHTYVGPGAQIKVMLQYRSVNIAGGQSITGKSWDGSTGGIMGWFCDGTTTVAGGLEIDGTTGVGSSPNNNNITQRGGFRGGGGWRSSSQPAISGDGSEGLRAQTNNPYGSAGIGGRQSGGDSGGGGGANGANGGNGDSNSGTGGFGGLAVGNPALTVMLMGGGGGGGRTDDAEGGHGGSGGGIIVIVSRKIIVTGPFHSNGGHGFGIAQASGGGGAGGSILLKGITMILGSDLVQCVAGVGASAASSQNGGSGSDGRIHVDYAKSITGSGTRPAFDVRQDSSLVPLHASPAMLFRLKYRRR